MNRRLRAPWTERWSRTAAWAGPWSRLVPAPVAVALGAGAVSTVIYLSVVWLPLRLDRHPPSLFFNLARALGEDATGLTLFAAAMLALFALYLAGVAAIERMTGRTTATAVLVGVVLSATVLGAHPWYSYDVYHYVATGRVLHRYHENPLTLPPSAFPDDRATALSDWRDLPSPYGPLWALVQAAPYHAAGAGVAAQVIAYKALAAGATLLTALLAGAIAHHLRPGARATAIALVLWNPLVVLHTAGDAHNDMMMLAALMAALYVLVRGRPGWAGWPLAAAALIKVAALVAVPFVVGFLLRSARPRRRREAVLVVVALPVLAAALYSPFWQGPETVHTLVDEGRYVTTSWPAVVRPALERWIAAETAESMLTTGVRLAFLPVACWLVWRTRGDPVDLLCRLALFLVLLLALATPWYMPWYALWPAPIVAAVWWQRRALSLVLALSLGALLLPVATNYLTVISGDNDGWPAKHAVATVLAFGPLAVVALWWACHRLPARGDGPGRFAEREAPTPENGQ